jgi:formylglycine-generating enzyme required for sulfatase activity
MKPCFKKSKSVKWLGGVFISFLFLVGLLFLGFGYTKWQSQEIVAQVQTMTRVVQLPGNVTMELVYISPGSFLMGSPVNEAKRGWDETQHEVELTDGFWLGKYEVTQEQWQAIMGHNPSTFSGCRFPVGNVDWTRQLHFVSNLHAWNRVVELH